MTTDGLPMPCRTIALGSGNQTQTQPGLKLSVYRYDAFTCMLTSPLMENYTKILFLKTQLSFNDILLNLPLWGDQGKTER